MAGSKLYLNVRNIISSTVCAAFSTCGHCVFFQSHPIWKPMFSSGVDVYLRSWPCAVDRAICGAQAARLDIWGSTVQYFWRPLKKERYMSVRTALWWPTWQRFILHPSPRSSGKCGSWDASWHSCTRQADHYGWGLLWDGSCSTGQRNSPPVLSWQGLPKMVLIMVGCLWLMVMLMVLVMVTYGNCY